jgi:mono/diheme cytochrome c family protein
MLSEQPTDGGKTIEIVCGTWLLIGSTLAFMACAVQPSGEKKSTKFDQYYIQGEQLYIQHCSNCHQKNGKGLGLVYPPIDSSDYMDNYFNEVICLIRYGKSGELTVNGKQFNQAMPGIPTLTDLEIAEIGTYIYNTWSHERGLLEVTEASRILNSCPK